MTCPECGIELSKVIINAPATVEVLQEVTAEVTFEEWRKDVRHESDGTPYLCTFRLDDLGETLDKRLDHRTLEIAHEDALFWCPECNAELPRAAVFAAVVGETTPSEYEALSARLTQALPEIAP